MCQLNRNINYELIEMQVQLCTFVFAPLSLRQAQFSKILVRVYTTQIFVFQIFSFFQRLSKICLRIVS